MAAEAMTGEPTEPPGMPETPGAIGDSSWEMRVVRGGIALCIIGMIALGMSSGEPSHHRDHGPSDWTFELNGDGSLALRHREVPAPPSVRQTVAETGELPKSGRRWLVPGVVQDPDGGLFKVFGRWP